MKTPTPAKSAKRTTDAEVKILQCAPVHRTARSVALIEEIKEPPPSPRNPAVIDAGIRQAVKRMQEAGIETFESCEGGAGHSYPEPTVAFHGGPEAGWRALSVCLTYALPVQSIQATTPRSSIREFSRARPLVALVSRCVAVSINSSPRS